MNKNNRHMKFNINIILLYEQIKLTNNNMTINNKKIIK